jgi:hypothetical protein
VPNSTPAKKTRSALWRLPNSETSSALAMRHAPAIDAIDTRRFLAAASMCPSKRELFTAGQQRVAAPPATQRNGGSLVQFGND